MFKEAVNGFRVADRIRKRPDAAVFSNGSESCDPKTRKRTVLVVDDEKRIADTLCEILRMYDFEAVAAYDGWDALDTITRFRPDYLLTDVLMPRMNGVELAIAVHNSCPAAKILLFSGQAGISGILESGKERGFNFPVVAKPIHPLKLLQQLKEL